MSLQRRGVKTEILRILAEQVTTLAAMADFCVSGIQPSLVSHLRLVAWGHIVLMSHPAVFSSVSKHRNTEVLVPTWLQLELHQIWARKGESKRNTLQRRKRRTIKEASLAQSKTKAILTTVSSNYNFTSSIPSYAIKNIQRLHKSSYFGTQVFTYEELEVATDNFNDSRELGDGGFGTVYYGKLIDGREVAMKRLYENNFKRVEQFLNEVEILTQLEHENLVKLYGCMSKRRKELILVYEYIPNGTVADHLHGKLANSRSSIFSCHGDSENTLTLGNDDPFAGNSSSKPVSDSKSPSHLCYADRLRSYGVSIPYINSTNGRKVGKSI
ncbi:leaf rust 10 disease-resistance locus receptor-like protein kinase-like 1.4 protein [Tanacetum coccineum]